jgi:hypothetical protein
MCLDEFVDIEANERAERRRLAAEKSYAILDRAESVAGRVERAVSDDSVVGSVAPSTLVGRTGYPDVSAGILPPVGTEGHAGRFIVSDAWCADGIDLTDVFRRWTSLLNARRAAPVDVRNRWDGFVGVGRSESTSPDAFDSG